MIADDNILDGMDSIVSTSKNKMNELEKEAANALLMLRESKSPQSKYFVEEPSEKRKRQRKQRQYTPLSESTRRRSSRIEKQEREKK